MNNDIRAEDIDIRVFHGSNDNRGLPVHIHVLDKDRGRVLAVVTLHAAHDERGNSVSETVSTAIAEALTMTYQTLES